MPQTSYKRRQVIEWAFQSTKSYENPFADVTLDALFTSPDGTEYCMPGFYDGQHTWKVRFNPNLAGEWRLRTRVNPPDADLDHEERFQVSPAEDRGFLRSTPGTAWGFSYENGDAAFLMGDTVYHLFAMQYCGGDVKTFLERRAEQGFNLLRVRVPVSPYHPPEGHSAWQTRRTWPWGGSEQSPQFDRFNLDYFQTVDDVVAQAERLGIGLEMIMEAWGFEFPFNSRQIFLPEWEEFWMRYLIARYDAYRCLYFWTPMNEYENYPNGDWNYKTIADRWAMRVARWIKRVGPHGHIIGIHNGPREPGFARRFAADPGAVDTILFQEWGTTGAQDGWLAAGIEEQIDRSLGGWWGSAIFAEYGYERNPEFDLLLPPHEFCDPEHTRRSAWRGAFCGLNVIHGFENSWGPWMRLEEDQPGMAYVLLMRKFFLEVVPFAQLRPSPDLLLSVKEQPLGAHPRLLASSDQAWVTMYFPMGGDAAVRLPQGSVYHAAWFNPRTGQMLSLKEPVPGGDLHFTAPPEQDAQGHPYDAVLVLHRA